MKSILFLTGQFGVGGVERVTVTLANAMVKRGDKVCVAAFDIPENSLIDELDDEVEVLCFATGWLTKANCAMLREVLMRRGVTHIINQWCLPVGVTIFCRRAAKGLSVRLLAVHHTMPNRNARVMGAHNPILKFIWRVISGLSLHLVYRFSDAYVLLSPSYVPIFKKFAWVYSSKKLFSIANPVVIERQDGVAKENAILYVGRLTETEKRVDRVIDIWKELSERIPDWRLDIVGDGPDRARLEERAKGLARITFHGFQKPNRFYAQSKLLLLTSDFEGFALVLVECMAMGCVPIVYASYPAAKDIVRGGGKLLTPPFRASEFADAIVELAQGEQKLNEMSKRALTISDDFGLDPIMKKWDEVLSFVG